MKPGRTWLVYTLIRLGIFAAVLALLLLLGITPWISAVLAAIISLCISIIVLRRPRDEVSKSLYRARESKEAASRVGDLPRSDDELAEDDAVDSTGRAPAADAAQKPNDNPRPTP